MEGVAYNLNIILDAFKNGGEIPDGITVTGGGARNRIWLNILSDISGLPIFIPERLEEATSMGAAITAGVGIGAFESFDAAEKFISIKSEIKPQYENSEKYGKMKQLFDEAYYSLTPLFEKL